MVRLFCQEKNFKNFQRTKYRNIRLQQMCHALEQKVIEQKNGSLSKELFEFALFLSNLTSALLLCFCVYSAT
jgi:hypothetical protein